MPQHSAGILPYRRCRGGIAVLLAHPGGPYWRRRDVGAWQIAKGQIMAGETSEQAARREVREELGITVDGPLIGLGQVRQSGGKLVDAFAIEQDVDAAAIRSNEFELEWPPRSGTIARFPEIDAARWFALDEARTMILASQAPLLDRLAAITGSADGPAAA